MDTASYGELLGFETRMTADGSWITSLHMAVKTDTPPDMGTLARWMNQVNRNTNAKLGSSAVPIPPSRRRLPAPVVTV